MPSKNEVIGGLVAFLVIMLFITSIVRNDYASIRTKPKVAWAMYLEATSYQEKEYAVKVLKENQQRVLRKYDEAIQKAEKKHRDTVVR